jgi:hypothetical protein
MRSLHPTCRTQRRARRPPEWLRTVGYGILLSLLGHPLMAANSVSVNNYATYAPQPRLQVDMDDGITCSVTDPSPPALVVYGRWRKGNEASSTGPSVPDIINTSDGVGGGVALLVPLGGTGYRNSCSALLQLQMNRAKLALAKQLLDDGLITDEEMKKTVANMHRSLGIR